MIEPCRCFRRWAKPGCWSATAARGKSPKSATRSSSARRWSALAEALITAQKAGVDPSRVVEAIKGGAAQMWTLDVKPPRLFAGNRKPGFKAYMQHKDLGIVLDTAKTYGIPLPMTAVVMQLVHGDARTGQPRTRQQRHHLGLRIADRDHAR